MRARPLPSARASAAASALVAALVCGALAATESGCVLSSAVGHAASSLVATPRKVTKLKEPIDKDARLAVLWIGHATALVQIDDKVILTDPVFTSTVGVLSKRIVEPGLDPENLPHVDAVVISHMHFDHLSLGSLATIESKVGTLLMPTGGVAYLTDFGFPVVELGPWQGWEKNGLRVTATPVDHLGGRYGLDGTWAPPTFTGYVIEYHGLKVYFGGDSAYRQELFTQTAQHFPGIDVALLPISPIEPRDFMRRVHMDPPEALQAFFDLGAKHMVPIHYDTFINSADVPGDALRALQTAQTQVTKRYSLGKRDVTTIAIGERHVFLKKGEGPEWSDAPEKPKDEGNWDAPATPSGAPADKPKPAPEPKPKKNDIPDDDRLD